MPLTTQHSHLKSAFGQSKGSLKALLRLVSGSFQARSRLHGRLRKGGGGAVSAQFALVFLGPHRRPLLLFFDGGDGESV